MNSPIRTPGSVHSPMAAQPLHAAGATEYPQFFSPSNEANFAQQGEFTPQAVRSPSRPQLASPPAMPLSPFVARTPNPNNNASSPAPQFSQPAKPQQYHVMTINGQQMYPATPNVAPGNQAGPRVTYIQPGQFAYAQPQGQAGQQPGGQWIAVQQQPAQQCVQPNQSARIVTQQVQRGAVIHRFPPGYAPANVQGTMVYSTVPASSASPRVTIRPQYATQVVTTQAQMVVQGGIIPGQPQTPTQPIPTPGTPGPSTPSAGFYQQNYPPGFAQGEQQIYVSHHRPPGPTSNVVRQFVPTNNGIQPQTPTDSNHYPSLVTSTNGPTKTILVQQSQIQVPQPVPGGQFSKPAQLEMRSPMILSPNQVPGAQIPMAMSQHPLGQQQMIPRQHSMRLPQPQFFTEPVKVEGWEGTAPPQSSFSNVDLRTIAPMIRYYGGDIELYRDRKSGERATHIVGELISSAHMNSFGDAKDNRRRLCTLQWLNDVIEKRNVEAPFKVCHLPATHNRTMNNTNKVISVTGFDNREVSNIKWMTQIIGAKFCPYLSKHTTHLVAKSQSDPKVHKVAELQMQNVQVVNALWLSELYCGVVNPLREMKHVKYSCTTSAPLIMGAQNLAKLNEYCVRMMYPWQFPLVVTDDQVVRAMETKKQILLDEALVVSNKYSKLFACGATPTDEQIEAAVEVLKKENALPDISIVLSGFPNKEIEILTRKIEILGVRVVDKVEDADAVVAPVLLRTTNMFKALASGKDIISPMWIINSFAQLRIAEFEDYYLHDISSEKVYNCNVRATTMYARRQPVFTNVRFFLSPSVKPSREELAEIIQCAGGIVDEEKPSRYTIAKCVEEDRPYIIIAHPCDLIFFQAFTEASIPIFSEEFVFCAIMRYKIDTTNFFSINLNHQRMVPLARMSATPTPTQNGTPRSNSAAQIAT